MKLDRKVAVITGAASGIGAATARLFAKEGARLVLIDIDRENLAAIVEQLEKAAAIVVDIEGDVSTPEMANSAIARTMSQFGRLDILVNNAGVMPSGTLVDCTEECWRRTLDVNLKSMYLFCRSVLPVMQHQGGGSIVNMSSVAGATGVPGRGVYSVASAAVIGLTRSLAADFSAERIRVNCICAGNIDTPLLRRELAAAADPESALLRAVAAQPVGRMGTPAEVAQLVRYLASDDSSFMTGQVILLDGGMKL